MSDIKKQLTLKDILEFAKEANEETGLSMSLVNELILMAHDAGKRETAEPDLLEAVEDALDCADLEYIPGQNWKLKARAAIAKAKGGEMSEQLAQWKPFFEGYRALQFNPGDWWQWDCEDNTILTLLDDMFCIHYSAPEPTIAHFEVALDGVIQDYEIVANAPKAYVHNLAAGKCNNPRRISIKRKESDDPAPVFVFGLDGVVKNSYLRKETK